MYEEEFNQIKGIISKLRVDANAKVVFLVDKNGQRIAAQGRSRTWTPRRSRRSPRATSPPPTGSRA
jgi:hypothetical protein